MAENNVVNILIVDDSIANIYALENMLSKPGRNFISATNGNEALKAALNKDISLIILDVQMPEMDGFEVAQILKSNKKTKEIPIIFASAEQKERRSMVKGFEEGAVDYLHKPLDQEITEAKVSVLLKLHLQKQELIRKNTALEKYALLINNSADIICIINPLSFEIEEMNNAVFHSLGYSPQEVKGTSLFSYLTEEHSLQIKELGKTSQENISFDTQIIDKHENIKWFHWNIVNKSGLWFANARDITQQNKSKEEIKQLNIDLRKYISQLEVTNKELESFSFSVSHDLRAPLRAINGYIKIIQQQYKAHFDDELQRLLGVIQTSATKMATLIDDLLAFSRLGRKDLIRTNIDTSEMVKQIMLEMELSAHPTLHIEIGMLLPAKGDYRLIYQVFYNLISNAVKYSSKTESPKVEIGSYKNNDELIYYVKDNGTGFNMNYAHKLFIVFQRLHSDDEFEGTGIGLAIVQRIILKHGGRAWAEGEEGKGATFYISLPCTGGA